MKKHFLLLSTFFVTFFTYGMETFETSPSIKRKLDETLQRFGKNISKPYLWAAMQDYLNHDYNHEVAKIVLTAGNEMCDLEKLEYLIGDSYYKNRKEIICNIINNIKAKNFDPCTICYQDTNPLEESIFHKDIAFTKYLLRAGAKPNKKVKETLKMYPCLLTNQISELFMLFESDTSKTYELVGIQYKKNNFGDIFPLWQDIPQEELLSNLSQFVSFLDMAKGTPCIIEVPHSRGAVLDIIKQAGFTLHYANSDKTEWIFKNNSPIPLPFNAAIGALVVVKKDDMVLVIEEKTRPGLLEFPAGSTELKELPRQTAVRELLEEVNLSVCPNDLELFAIVNKTRENRFNANAVHHCYTVNHDKISGILKPDNNEVTQAFYAPLQDIAKQKSIQGLSVSSKIAALAKHLKEDRIKSYSQNFLEARQLLKEKKFHDNNDIETIEFFAK